MNEKKNSSEIDGSRCRSSDGADSVPKTGEGVMGWMPEILLLAAAGLVTFGGILRRRSKIHL